MASTQRFMATLTITEALSLLAGHVAATQWFAHEIHYQDAFLGQPLLIDRGLGAKLYLPHKIYMWRSQYMGQGVDDLIQQSLMILVISAILGFVLGALFWKITVSREKIHTSHGSARWATPNEIKATGMLIGPKKRLKNKEWLKTLRGKDPEKAASSVTFGKNERGKFFYQWGPEHILAFAPTRSGKGVGMVVPTLLTWTESVLITDIKGENFQITAFWRSLFSHVVYFNPTDPNSAHFNPLLELPMGRESIAAAMNLAEIIGERPQGEESPFWDGGAKKFLTAVILYTLYTQHDKSLGRCAKLLMYYEDTLSEMSMCTISEPTVQEYIRGIAQSGLDKSESVRGGWAAGADGALDLWKDPVVVETTSTSDFRLEEMQYARRAMSVYLVIPPRDLKRLSPLVRLFFQQLTDELTKELNDRADNEPHRLLMMMDEFPQFGNMEKIERAIAYTAGYGIKWFFITQGLDQLDKIYGKDNNFLSNCHLRLAYCCNDDRNAARLSKLLGEATGFKKQLGESGKKGILAHLSNRNVSQVEFARPLMTPGELQQLPPNRTLIMTAGQYPIQGYKITYYDDPFFIPRYKNKRWNFPLEPLDDFPSHTLSFDWYKNQHAPKRSSHTQSMLVKDLPPSIQELHEEGKKGGEGETPYTEAINKIDTEDVDHLAIPVEMNARDARIELTTRAFQHTDLEHILEKALHAGKMTPEEYQSIQAKLHQKTSSASDTGATNTFEHGKNDSVDQDSINFDSPFDDISTPPEHSVEHSEPSVDEPSDLEDLYAEFGFDDPSLPEHAPEPDMQEAPGLDPALSELPDTDDTLVVTDMEDRIRQAMQEGARIKALDDSFSFTHPFDDDVD